MVRTSLLIFLITGIVVACGDGPTNQDPAQKGSEEASYDSILAARVGADDYGMKRYVMAFLKAGPNRDQDSATVAEIQAGHMAHIGEMADAGTLVIAGPFLDGGDLRGIFVFDTTMEEAEALTAADPAVQSGRLIMELIPWYGSAALVELGNLHKRVARKSF